MEGFGAHTPRDADEILPVTRGHLIVLSASAIDQCHISTAVAARDNLNHRLRLIPLIVGEGRIGDGAARAVEIFNLDCPTGAALGCIVGKATAINAPATRAPNQRAAIAIIADTTIKSAINGGETLTANRTGVI